MPRNAPGFFTSREFHLRKGLLVVTENPTAATRDSAFHFNTAPPPISDQR